MSADLTEEACQDLCQFNATDCVAYRFQQSTTSTDKICQLYSYLDLSSTRNTGTYSRMGWKTFCGDAVGKIKYKRTEGVTAAGKK